MGVVLLAGIVLAIDHDDFQLWDGWVIAAIVLWALIGWAGDRSGKYYTERRRSPRAASRTRRARCSARLRAPAGLQTTS